MKTVTLSKSDVTTSNIDILMNTVITMKTAMLNHSFMSSNLNGAYPMKFSSLGQTFGNLVQKFVSSVFERLVPSHQPSSCILRSPSSSG